jgi:hypothetical protein
MVKTEFEIQDRNGSGRSSPILCKLKIAALFMPKSRIGFAKTFKQKSLDYLIVKSKKNRQLLYGLLHLAAPYGP